MIRLEFMSAASAVETAASAGTVETAAPAGAVETAASAGTVETATAAAASGIDGAVCLPFADKICRSRSRGKGHRGCSDEFRIRRCSRRRGFVCDFKADDQSDNQSQKSVADVFHRLCDPSAAHQGSALAEHFLRRPGVIAP